MKKLFLIIFYSLKYQFYNCHPQIMLLCIRYRSASLPRNYENHKNQNCNCNNATLITLSAGSRCSSCRWVSRNKTNQVTHILNFHHFFLFYYVSPLILIFLYFCSIWWYLRILFNCPTYFMVWMHCGILVLMFIL